MRDKAGLAAKSHGPGSLAALISSYKASAAYQKLGEGSRRGYNRRLEKLRVEHGRRSVAGLTRQRIEGILAPLADRPGEHIDTLKKLRILIRHAMSLPAESPLHLNHDPSLGIKRPKLGENRAWTDAELAAYEERWPVGTKQRTASALMLHVGAARADVHRIARLMQTGRPDGHASLRRSVTGPTPPPI